MKSKSVCVNLNENPELQRMVNEIEATYVMSAEANNVSPNDFEYFRRYMWVLLAANMTNSFKKGETK